MRKAFIQYPLIILPSLLVIYLLINWACQAWEKRPLSGKLTITNPGLAEGMHSFRAGNFLIDLVATGQEHAGEPLGPRLVISHINAPGRWLWHSRRGKAFVSAAQGTEAVIEKRGSYFFSDQINLACQDQDIQEIRAEGSYKVTIYGTLSCTGTQSVGYTLVFTQTEDRQLSFVLSFDEPAINRAYLTYASDADEHFFGFGEQFTYFDLKGQWVPIWVSEQGIGRGLQPLTFLVDRVAQAGGTPFTTYAAVPQYISSRMRSLFLENSEFSFFDLRDPDQVQICAYTQTLSGRILFGSNPEELIAEYTSWAGRMRPLPDWIHSGAVVGMQGGTQRVREVYTQLVESGTPISAFWLQDWVGQRTTSFGKQLWWNWELDENRYPGWDLLRKDLEANGIRLLVYTSPFLADVSEKPGVRRNLFDEAKQKGYLVMNGTGEPYLIQNTDFSAGLVDLTNPSARDWYKAVLKEQLVDQAGASGWMADFGEALPYDASLSDGQTGRTFHNLYPQAWAQLNRELVDSLPNGDEYVFFQRAAYQRSPAYSTLFWEGDQLVSWDQYDGIKSAVTGLLSGGMSGISLNHSDIGGYTTINNPLARYNRSKELLLRWMEFSAMTTVYRTHEGNIPDSNAQFYSDTETMAQFTRMAKVYAAWKDFRVKLVNEAARTGVPVARHLFIHYPDDPQVYSLSYQEYMLGSEILVAPVLDPSQTELKVYLPEGTWVHIWTGVVHRTPYRGKWVTVPAPIGQPAIFYKEGSTDGIQFRLNLASSDLVP